MNRAVTERKLARAVRGNTAHIPTVSSVSLKARYLTSHTTLRSFTYNQSTIFQGVGITYENLCEQTEQNMLTYNFSKKNECRIGFEHCQAAQPESRTADSPTCCRLTLGKVTCFFLVPQSHGSPKHKIGTRSIYSSYSTGSVLVVEF